VSAAERKFSIGRNRGCDVPIADPSVSRLHAELTVLAGGKLSLADRGSSNGTTLIRQGKSQRINDETVWLSDRIRFGSVELSVKEILEAISHKYPDLELAELPGSGRAAPSQGNRLVRCACGAIKPGNERCPACGE
jgi:pSer/pThr/pTyr-binding forkhead associated (FHA) protein